MLKYGKNVQHICFDCFVSSYLTSAWSCALFILIKKFLPHLFLGGFILVFFKLWSQIRKIWLTIWKILYVLFCIHNRLKPFRLLKSLYLKQRWGISNFCQFYNNRTSIISQFITLSQNLEIAHTAKSKWPWSQTLIFFVVFATRHVKIDKNLIFAK